MYVEGFQDVWAFDRLPYADSARNSSTPPSHLNFNKIPLMGFGTFGVTDPQVIFNALSVGYRHLDRGNKDGNA